jgi:hypothetical protein
LPLTPTQYSTLKKWASGQFVNDFLAPISEAPLPEILDRRLLDSCSGAPLFPGIEVGRIIRDPQIYCEPFRIDDRLEPGTLTQGNAVPWQQDFYQCHWNGHPFLGWWPAQRPDHVLIDPASRSRADWLRGISGDVGELGMIEAWHRLGIIVRLDDQFLETERTL